MQRTLRNNNDDYLDVMDAQGWFDGPVVAS